MLLPVVSVVSREKLQSGQFPNRMTFHRVVCFEKSIDTFLHALFIAVKLQPTDNQPDQNKT